MYMEGVMAIEKSVHSSSPRSIAWKIFLPSPRPFYNILPSTGSGTGYVLFIS